MKSDIAFVISVLTGFFAIMNPIANTPIFIGLTENLDQVSKKRVALKSTVIAFIIVTSFILAGHLIFKLFGISIPAFKITGGILIFSVGFRLLRSKKARVNNALLEDEVSSVAVSPLGIPILAGPGTLVTGINFASNSDWIHILVVIGGFGVMCYLTYICFVGANKLIGYLGANLISVVSKIMGLILCVMGTDMVISGIKLAFFNNL
ncbi:MAG: MarC family protein [Prolixibacteraceae bacterium]|jgi:multiple antibiotic resistance protein|nr:MarC family protein [Prolixibacteraceae bacterium]